MAYLLWGDGGGKTRVFKGGRWVGMHDVVHFLGRGKDADGPQFRLSEVACW